MILLATMFGFVALLSAALFTLEQAQRRARSPAREVPARSPDGQSARSKKPIAARN
jgi:Flp pilus assembly protein TadB